jgi:hypothetical protein
MFDLLWLWFAVFVCLFRSRRNVMIENLACVINWQSSSDSAAVPGLQQWTNCFGLSFAVSGEVLIVVSPDTVVRWHRAGFQLYWRLISRVRKRIGRKPVTKEIRELIFKMVAENPTWRAPRIHGELIMLGYDISERSISRGMRHAPQSPNSAQRWLTFLRNHREGIAAMDFFSVPTITFGVLYCFFIISPRQLHQLRAQLLIATLALVAVTPH